jgi:hypothetical protein
MASAAPATSPGPERLSVTTGQLLAEGMKPVGEAVMSVHHPAHPNGAAVMIYPGGGYTMLVVEPEGHHIAEWFAEHGVTGIVVEYRLPHGDSSLPLADAERATRIVRSHAAEWKLERFVAVARRIELRAVHEGACIVHLYFFSCDRLDACANGDVDHLKLRGCRGQGRGLRWYERRRAWFTGTRAGREREQRKR